MKYLLDTDICIYIIKNKTDKILNKLTSTEIGDVCISVITLSELEYGISKSSKPLQNKLALLEFLSPINIVSYDENAAVKYGSLRADLEEKGNIVGSMDMLIAAHALSAGLVLITNNEKEFRRIKNLKIENWLK